MTEHEFKLGFSRLIENFGKQDPGKFKFLFEELRALDTSSWKKCPNSAIETWTDSSEAKKTIFSKISLQPSSLGPGIPRLFSTPPAPTRFSRASQTGMREVMHHASHCK